MQRSIRILCTGALAVGLTLAAGVGAHGALIDFSAPATATAGSTITVSSVAPCAPFAEEVLVALSATGSSQPPLASATTTSDSGGNWSVQLTIPVDLTPGVYDLQAFCSDTDPGATAIDPPSFTQIQYDLSSIEITAAAQSPAAEEVTAAPRTAG